jgi:hypothetical protein
MHVYRYEKPRKTEGIDIDGQYIIPRQIRHLGPYSAEWPFKESLQNDHNRDEANHPFPLDDFGRISFDYRYGCDSLESLNKWFKGWHNRLKEWGFVIVRYNITNPFQSRSGMQVAFNAWESRTVVDT